MANGRRAERIRLSRTVVRPRKGMKELTRPVQIAASQLVHVVLVASWGAA